MDKEKAAHLANYDLMMRFVKVAQNTQQLANGQIDSPDTHDYMPHTFQGSEFMAHVGGAAIQETVAFFTVQSPTAAIEIAAWSKDWESTRGRGWKNTKGEVDSLSFTRSSTADAYTACIAGPIIDRTIGLGYGDIRPALQVYNEFNDEGDPDNIIMSLGYTSGNVGVLTRRLAQFPRLRTTDLEALANNGVEAVAPSKAMPLALLLAKRVLQVQMAAIDPLQVRVEAHIERLDYTGQLSWRREAGRKYCLVPVRESTVPDYQTYGSKRYMAAIPDTAGENLHCYTDDEWVAFVSGKNEFMQ